ncbi:MAG: 1-acyl-sn-glycerol-3-phosphate acyltransferase [Planctomycetes bacterium]|nr:1-acyl-sn-glycerol-3-phosphate acyltransferase [Planctomycetota bacterium]
MTEPSPAEGRPPTACEIERRFRSPAVIVTRSVILGSIGALRAARSFGWQAEGLHHFQDLEPPLILAANHQSHADTAAILGTLPRPVRERTAVAAALDVFGRADNGRMPSLKRECLQLVVAAGFHAFAFDRHGPPLRSVRTAAQLIRNGWNLLLYPEGTRSRTGEMAPFKAGVGALARFTRRSVIPIHVVGGRRILPCGAIIPRPGQITVRYGRPLRYQRGETLAGFTLRLQARVQTLRSPHGRE